MIVFVLACLLVSWFCANVISSTRPDRFRPSEVRGWPKRLEWPEFMMDSRLYFINLGFYQNKTFHLEVQMDLDWMCRLRSAKRTQSSTRYQSWKGKHLFYLIEFIMIKTIDRYIAVLSFTHYEYISIYLYMCIYICSIYIYAININIYIIWMEGQFLE